MPGLDDPVSIGDCRLRNRLYRAPLLECAGNGPDAVDTLIDELEPAAAAGAGLISQGASIVTREGGCAAPNMTRVHDPSFLAECERLTQRIESHGSRIFIQLAHGGLRSLETWHQGYRERHPDLRQLAPSRPPWVLRALERLGFLAFDAHVLSTSEVYDLADAFGEAAAAAVDAGYHGIHIAGANMGIVEQFSSPLYNRREDEFGEPSDGPRPRFLEVLHDAIRKRVGEGIPIITKVPAESHAPAVVRRHLDRADGIELAVACAEAGYDALVPVTGTGFWDASIVRGAYPARAWSDPRFQEGYDEAFGGCHRRRLVALANRIQARQFAHETGWNVPFCRAVSDRVDVPVLAEGGLRRRSHIDRLIDSGACDLVGMARPFYAEPRLPRRLLGNDQARALCESCNNCTVPQVAGARGVCRTPEVLERRGELERAGAYEEST